MRSRMPYAFADAAISAAIDAAAAMLMLCFRLFSAGTH